MRRPYFEPARERIFGGSGLSKLSIGTDGTSTNRTEKVGDWISVHTCAPGSCSTFARILVPLQADPDILRIAALDVAEHVPLFRAWRIMFVYEPSLLEDAFDEIYGSCAPLLGRGYRMLKSHALADQERHQGGKLAHSGGPEVAVSLEIPVALADLAKAGEVTTVHRRHATVLVAGPHPVPGDQHRPDRSLHPYEAIANALKPLFLDDILDFPGERFVTNGNTVGWIRRFIDPAGWR